MPYRIWTGKRMTCISLRYNSTNISELLAFQVDVGSESSKFHQNTVTTVRIKVSDVNDNAPKVENSRIPITIRDGLKNGDVLYR